MKKITLLVASIFLFGGIVAHAADKNHKSPVDFRNTEPIVFTENGVEFYVFADGQFDFNLRQSNRDVNYNSNRRYESNKYYGKPGNSPKWNNGVAIEYARNGKISRVGNVIIRYDSHDRIKQIGSVDMDYNRYGLTQVGGLHIVYNNHRQIVDIYGAVNRYNDNQYDSRKNDNYVDYNAKPNKVVASLEIRINR